MFAPSACSTTFSSEENTFPFEEKGLTSGHVQTRPVSRKEVEKYLIKKYGADTIVRWNNVLNRPQSIRFYDHGISEEIHEGNIHSYATSQFNELSEIVDLNVKQLAFKEVSQNDYMINITYIQTINGIPVWQSGISVEILRRNMGGADKDHVRIAEIIYPDISISTEPAMSSDEAAIIGSNLLRTLLFDYERQSKKDKTLIHEPRLVIYPKGVPKDNPKRYEYYLVWRLDYLPRWGIYVDAHSGDIISKGVGPIP